MDSPYWKGPLPGVDVQRRYLWKTFRGKPNSIPGSARKCSASARNPVRLHPGMLFGFSPESCSTCPGMLFGLPRNTPTVELKLPERQIVESVNEEAKRKSLELAGCYVLVSDVVKETLSTEQIHDSYMALQKVERDFRTMKTGLLEIRPVFVRKESRTRGHVFCSMLALKLQREVEHRLDAVFGTTDADRYAVTVPDALAALSRLTLLHYKVDDKIVVTKLPMPDQQQQRILDALKVSLPSK